jgi:hypothetical protein
MAWTYGLLGTDSIRAEQAIGIGASFLQCLYPGLEMATVLEPGVSEA